MVRQVKLAILLAYLTAVLVKQACAHSSGPLVSAALIQVYTSVAFILAK